MKLSYRIIIGCLFGFALSQFIVGSVSAIIITVKLRKIGTSDYELFRIDKPKPYKTTFTSIKKALCDDFGIPEGKVFFWSRTKKDCLMPSSELSQEIHLQGNIEINASHWDIDYLVKRKFALQVQLPEKKTLILYVNTPIKTRDLQQDVHLLLTIAQRETTLPAKDLFISGSAFTINEHYDGNEEAKGWITSANTDNGLSLSFEATSDEAVVEPTPSPATIMATARIVPVKGDLSSIPDLEPTPVTVHLAE